MKWLYDLKIRTKLISGFIIIACIASFIGYMGYSGINKMETQVRGIAENDLPSVQNLLIMKEALTRIDGDSNGLVVLGLKQADRDVYYADISAAYKRFDAARVIFESVPQISEEATLWRTFPESYDKFKSVDTEFQKICKAYDVQKTDANYAAMSNYGLVLTSNALEQVSTTLDKAIENNKQQAVDSDINAKKTYSSTSIILMVFIIVGVLLSIVLGLILSNIISKPINKLIGIAKKIAEGDMKVEFDNDTKDEVGELNNSLATVVIAIKALILDVEMQTQDAIVGKLEARIDIAKHSGDYRKIVEGVNNTLDAVIEPIKEASTVLQEMSNGNLKVYVKGDYKGDHADIKNALNGTIDSLSSYVTEISEVLDEMSNSNLKLSINNEYKGDFAKIKDALNLIIESFNEVFSEINNAADQVSSGSSQVSDGSQALSQGTTEQASAIEELTSSITEVAAQTKQNAVSATQANELALSAKNGAILGNSHMKEMLKSMEEINESSSNISKIIKVIDDIAFQTNMLALNAAVEAARAGQHGKGFAVVAEEVRNLAARSANAAKETADLVEGSIKKVEFGTKIANNTAESLDQIVAGVSKAATLVGEIAAASNEQATAIYQINKGIEQVSDVVQTNSATAEQSAAASEELSGQARLLKNMVEKFKLKKGNLVDRETMKFSPKLEVPVTKSKPIISLSNSDFGKY